MSDIERMEAPLVRKGVKGFIAVDTEARFWSKVDKSGDCWLWTGSYFSTGYGQFWDGHGRVMAHRFSYGLAHGPIPDGLLALHRCDNPPCVRPDHLFLGTVTDNMRDMVSKGRHVNPQLRKTHCPQGHEYDRKFSSGRRYCSECNARRCREYRERRDGKAS